VEEHIVERRGLHVGDQRVHEGLCVSVIDIGVNLVLAVVRAGGVGGAVGRIPTVAEEAELGLAGIEAGP